MKKPIQKTIVNSSVEIQNLMFHNYLKGLKGFCKVKRHASLTPADIRSSLPFLSHSFGDLSL